MIILDTNIVSEFMTSQPATPVLSWLNAQDSAALYMTVISIAEISFGIRALPEGRRQKLLEERFEQFIHRAFAERILPFDETAARLYGDVKASRRTQGRPLSDFDGQIAAIGLTHGFAVATRNVNDFEQCGLELINPFEDG